jgi:hypothetical protein
MFTNINNRVFVAITLHFHAVAPAPAIALAEAYHDQYD